MPVADREVEQRAWCLEQCGGERRRLLVESPCIVGHALRQHGLASANVSDKHAELFLDGEQLHVRDLASTHGTFVNSQRVQDARVREGDVLGFGDCSFRLFRLFGAGGKFDNALLVYSSGHLVGYLANPDAETLELGVSSKIRGRWRSADTEDAHEFETELAGGSYLEVTVDGHPLATGDRTLISAGPDGEAWLVSTRGPSSR